MQENSGAAISVEECKRYADLLNKKYAHYVAARWFEASIEQDMHGVYAKVVLRNESSSFYYPVEGRLAYAQQSISVRDAALLLMEYIDIYFDQYFKEDCDVFLPIDWADFTCEGVDLQLKGQILNLEVEQLADDFLRSHGYH